MFEIIPFFYISSSAGARDRIVDLLKQRISGGISLVLSCMIGIAKWTCFFLVVSRSGGGTNFCGVP